MLNYSGHFQKRKSENLLCFYLSILASHEKCSSSSFYLFFSLQGLNAIGEGRYSLIFRFLIMSSGLDWVWHPVLSPSPVPHFIWSLKFSFIGDAWKALIDTAGGMIQDQETIVSLTKFVDQLPSVMNQVTACTSHYFTKISNTHFRNGLLWSSQVLHPGHTGDIRVQANTLWKPWFL